MKMKFIGVVHDAYLIRHPENLTLVPQEFGAGGRAILFENNRVLVLYDSHRTLMHELTHYVLFMHLDREHLHLGLDLLDSDSLFILMKNIIKSRCSSVRALREFSERLAEICEELSKIVDPKAVKIWKVHLMRKLKSPLYIELMKCKNKKEVKEVLRRVIESF